MKTISPSHKSSRPKAWMWRSGSGPQPKAGFD